MLIFVPWHFNAVASVFFLVGFVGSWNISDTTTPGRMGRFFRIIVETSTDQCFASIFLFFSIEYHTEIVSFFYQRVALVIFLLKAMDWFIPTANWGLQPTEEMQVLPLPAEPHFSSDLKKPRRDIQTQFFGPIYSRDTLHSHSCERPFWSKHEEGFGKLDTARGQTSQT